MLSRLPCPALLPFVQRVWASETEANGAAPLVEAERERVLPTGAMHLVLRLGAEPLTLFDDVDGHGARTVSDALIGGARADYYVRSLSPASRSVGAQLRPGASLALLGVPAAPLAARHTSLVDLWGREAEELRERLLETRSLPGRLALFEAALLARPSRPARPRANRTPWDLASSRSLLRSALASLEGGASVGEVVLASGYSHRAFVVCFREAVGLTPKTYARVRRFQRGLELLADGRATLAEVAASVGYADQAHFTRDFSDFAGVTPSAYRALAPASRNHLRVVPASPIPSRRRGWVAAGSFHVPEGGPRP